LTDALDSNALGRLREAMPLLASIVGQPRAIDGHLLDDVQELHTLMLDGRPYRHQTQCLFGNRKPPTSCDAGLLARMLDELRRITRLNCNELCAGNSFSRTLIRLEAERLGFCLHLYVTALAPAVA
jgi:hypothetical protein